MKKKTLIPVILVLLAAIAIYKILPYINPPEEKYLTVSGRVEASEIELGVQIPGRLRDVLIEDGAQVKKGDLVALMEDERLQSKRRELVKGLEELTEKIKAAEFNFKYTVQNVRHGIDEAKKALSIAKARLREAEAKKENSKREFRRYSKLREKGVIPAQRYDTIRLAYKLSEEGATTAHEELERAEVSLLKAEASKELVKAKEKELLALRKSLQRLKETLKQAEITLGYTRVVAPSDGIILTRVAEPGEVLPQGGVVGVMINPVTLHVKTFVPEKYIGRIYIAMAAEVFTDAYPEHPFTGYICYISDRAEFTPKEVQSYEERVKEVFAVKVCFSDRESTTNQKKRAREVLKKGMPVDVRFKIQD